MSVRLTIFYIIEDDMVNVNQFVEKRSHDLNFKAKLIRGNQEDGNTVYCYISPKVSTKTTYKFHNIHCN